MRKYFIILILSLFLGFLFAGSAYGQTLQDSKANDFYYKQYTYPVYIESGGFFETKYALTLRNVKYSDVEFTLTYLQPYIIYADAETTTMGISVLLSCIERNIEAVVDTIDYCRLKGYENEVIQTLQYFVQSMYCSFNDIRELAFQYINAYEEEDFASCIKYMIAIENTYWQLFIVIGSMENPDGTNSSYNYIYGKWIIKRIIRIMKMLTEVLVMPAIIVFISVVVINVASRKEKLNFFGRFSVVAITTAVVYFGYQIFWR